MDEHKYELNMDPAEVTLDADFYATGSTRPPKTHRGLLALMLACGIVLGSVITAMGGLNMRLLEKIRSNAQEATLPVSLQAGEGFGELRTDGLPVVTAPAGDASVVLKPSPASVDTPSQEGGMSLQDIYKKCIDSTVSIICSTSDRSLTGTGVVLSRNGYVITNSHVVEDAREIQVMTTDGRTLEARLVGDDALSDLAVLYVDADDLKAAEFGDSEALRVGDTVVAIGDPLGVALRGTMTDGIVSAINRNITTGGRTMTLIQTNAALNSGNSGGPLINCYGQVIGINTMKMGGYVSNTGVEGLGFAIPSATVKDIVDQLIHQGYVSGRPGLGVSGIEVGEFYQYYYHLPAGFYINEVDPNSDAYAKGVKVQDILLTVDGQRVYSEEDIRTILYGHEVGDTVDVILYRAGKQYSTQLVLGEADS